MKRNDRNETWTDNNIGAEGARMISESLKSNTTLAYLNLSGDRMTWKKDERGEENKNEKQW